jgi:hypothetical protein
MDIPTEQGGTMNRNTLFCFGLMALLTLPALGCATHERVVERGPGHRVVVVQNKPGPGKRVVVVHRRPPSPRVEVRHVAPSRTHVWVAGRWDWRGNDFVWISGAWVLPPRPQAVWAPGHWEHARGGWVWIDGHWR